MAKQTINSNVQTRMDTIFDRLDTVYKVGDSFDFTGEYNAALGSLADIDAAAIEDLNFVKTYNDEVNTDNID